MNLVAFAFENNIAQEVLQGLHIENSQYIASNVAYINQFVESVLAKKPQFILGLGQYKGSKQNLRLETKCDNTFRKKLRGNVAEQIDINPLLQPAEKVILSSRIGNSYCNLVSFKIMKEIKKRNLSTRYTFIHIPQKFNVKEAIIEINIMLER